MRDNTRLKLYPITLPLLMDIFTTGQKVRAEIVEGIPKDSVIVRHSYNRDLGMYFLTIQNDSFEPVKQLSMIPIGVIQVKHLDPNEVERLAQISEAHLWAKAASESSPEQFLAWAAARAKELQDTPTPVKKRKKVAVLQCAAATTTPTCSAEAMQEKAYEFADNPPAKSSTSVTTFTSTADKGRSI